MFFSAIPNKQSKIHWLDSQALLCMTAHLCPYTVNTWQITCYLIYKFSLDKVIFHIILFQMRNSLSLLRFLTVFLNYERPRYFCHLCSEWWVPSVVDLVINYCSLVISFSHNTLCWLISVLSKCYRIISLSSFFSLIRHTRPAHTTVPSASQTFKNLKKKNALNS